MKFIAYGAALAAIATCTAATPTPETAKSKPGDFKHYYLQSRIIDSGPADLGGLYVLPYHTGAGLADATLSKKPLFTAFINGTYLQFDLSSQTSGKQYFPTGVSLVLETEYTSFQPVQINSGYGDHGFYVKNGTLQSRFQKEFGGWRVCRWWHDNVPQLFHKFNFAEGSKISSNCADVDLVLVKA